MENTNPEEHFVELLLSESQVTLILEHALALDFSLEESLTTAEVAGKKRRIKLSLYDLDDLEGHVAAASNHCSDKKVQKRLDTIFDLIVKLQQKYSHL